MSVSLYHLSSAQVKSPGSPESARVLALLCLGEVGRTGSLGGSKEVQGVILEAISSTNEEVEDILHMMIIAFIINKSDHFYFLNQQTCLRAEDESFVMLVRPLQQSES